MEGETQRQITESMMYFEQSLNSTPSTPRRFRSYRSHSASAPPSRGGLLIHNISDCRPSKVAAAVATSGDEKPPLKVLQSSVNGRDLSRGSYCGY